jgi:hypothetical protein
MSNRLCDHYFVHKFKGEIAKLDGALKEYIFERCMGNPADILTYIDSLRESRHIYLNEKFEVVISNDLRQSMHVKD